MNKRLLTIIVNFMFIVMITNLLLVMYISQQSEIEMKQVLTFAMVMLIILVVGIVIKIALILYDNKYLPKESPREKDLILYILFLIASIIFTKFFYLSFSRKDLILQINILTVTESCFLIIPLYIFVNDYWSRYQKERSTVILELKQLYIQYALISPIVVAISTMYLLYVLSLKKITHFNLVLLLILFSIFFSLISLYFFLNYRYKIFSILLFKQSEDEKTRDLIKLLYNDPLKLEPYLNTKLRISTIINIVDTLILVPVLLIFLLLN